MRIFSRQSSLGKSVYHVELTPEENKLPDPVLVSIADGHTKESAIECHEQQLRPCHFGGYVTRQKVYSNGSALASIVVLTD